MDLLTATPFLHKLSELDSNSFLWEFAKQG